MVAGKPPGFDQTMRVDSVNAAPSLLSITHPRQRLVPERFGRYEVQKTLGAGGMGTVYLAYDTALDRLVALKVPHQESDDDPDVLERFHAEAQAAAGISHPNLCTIHDAGEIGGVPYLTMSYVRGRPLTDLLVTGEPLGQEHAALLVQQVAAAMEVAHQANIIHRDLKPANIMLGEQGAPVVMDFGVARRESLKRRRLTHQGTSLGTPGYMAPEMLRGETATAASDIYSLGVSLYQLLAGSLPFAGSAVETVRQVLRGDPPKPLHELRPDIDRQLSAICQQAMAARSEDRYPSMGALAEALAEFLRGRSRQFQIGDEEKSATSQGEVLSRAGEQLFLLGRWETALDVISVAAGLGGRGAIRQRNRLVHLCKNMDRWGEALAHSDWCIQRIDPGDPPELHARVGVNRGSVLYDLGRRREAGEAFLAARDHAAKCRSTISRAAANNNLGVHFHYGDQLARAEEALSDGLREAESLAAAYLETNLGLVQLTRSLADPAQAEAAEKTLQGVVRRFVAGGHLQGISYALSNRGLCDLASRRWMEARAAFEETIRLGERLGEKWTVYGATANLALLELARGGDAPKALERAMSAATGAAENSDPKGVADACLIAARAVLEGAPAPPGTAANLLEDAGERYAQLGQKLGEALACLGRMECLAGSEPELAALLESRARTLLQACELPSLPLRFFAPPWHMLLLLELF
jgi:tetratricopeptide (TPR) repeat protein